MVTSVPLPITTSAAPTVPDGVTIFTVDSVVDSIIAAFPPMVTELISERLLPVIVVEVPPLRGPVATENDEICGTRSEACT